MASVTKEVGAAVFLPDKIVVQILNKTDLKTLFNCKRVSRRFYQIACEVDTITFAAPSRRWRANDPDFCEHVRWLAVYSHERFSTSRFGQRFNRLVGGLIKSMTKFTRLRSLYIELPLKSSFKESPFLKWKVFIDSNTIDSFVLLSSTSIHDRKVYFNPYYDDHIDIADKCMEEALVRYMMLLGFARECPFLEKIFITDSLKRGRISLSGAKPQVIKSLASAAPPEVENFISKVRQHMRSSDVRGCRIPLLSFPVSGMFMKGVELTLYNYKKEDNFEDTNEEDDFEDIDEEAADGEEVGLPHKSYSDSDEEDDFEDEEEKAAADGEEGNDVPYEYSYDRYINIDDDFEDKEEAAFSEALMEIFNRHSDKIIVF